MTIVLIVVAVVILAYANGANDNFKGVATLFGSSTTDYKRALAWATLATFAGAVAGAVFAIGLLARFSGKGIVPETLTALPSYAAAVALGAGATVLLATRLGLPVSTTHALVGAIAGAGLAAGSDIAWMKLASLFALPLMVSPLLSLSITFVLATLVRFALRAPADSFAISAESGPEDFQNDESATSATAGPRERLLDTFHFLSAGAVSFARGMNDAPKIAAPLLLVTATSSDQAGTISILTVAFAMAVGGLISGRRVAETMSRKITPMTPATGLAANVATAAIVLAASPLALPVSTTHVSCGALFGLAASSGRAKLGTIATILVAWVTTLPLGAACGAGLMWAFRQSVGTG